MKLFAYIIIFLLIVWNVYLASVSAINGEVNFFNDVARDFLLLNELDEKKIVFIGPRSNTNNLFHGPLWTYLNYPAYLIGSGNPVSQAWFWIFIEVVFLISSFYIAKKLFNTFAGLGFALLLSARLVPHMNGVFHSEATFFFMPVFFFSMYEYLKTKKWGFLALHLFFLDFLIQLNIGVGLPLFILSLPLILWFIYKKKLYRHLFLFFLIPLFLVNLILFDIKHNFQMTKALIGTGGALKLFITIQDWIFNRIQNTISLELLDNSQRFMPFLVVIFIAVLGISIVQIKHSKKERLLYSLLLFYYFGYLILSVFNKGILLFHYVYVLIPLTYLWLSSFLRGKYIVLFGIIIGAVYIINLTAALNFKHSLEVDFMGKNYNSWKGLSESAKYVISEEKGREFGYFVFAPDSFAYQPRYAMLYNFKGSGGREYVKKQTTYVIAQPPPTNDIYMDYKWWVEVPVGIIKKPSGIKKFPNGYTVLRYTLTSEEQKIPHDKSIELGIHFR